MNMTMKNPCQPSRKSAVAAATATAIVFATTLLVTGCQKETPTPPAPSAPPGPVTMDLTTGQVSELKIGTVGTHAFPSEITAVGNIDYDEDLSVQVFSIYQGKIISNFFNLGDDVKKGQALYTIDSPDLLNAENNLISSVAAIILYSNELARATELYKTNGVARRELEQATSDANTAEGAYKTARDAVRIFGKTDEEIAQIETTRKADPVLVVPSPVSGRITAKFAQPGLLVQPGSVPAPYTVSDLTTKWMVANVTETDSTVLRVGQPVKATLLAYPTNVFEGKVSQLGTTLDPNVHRVMLRCDLADPTNALRPNMLATFTITYKEPVVSVAIPTTGVVRNSDGTFETWVTVDRHRFVERFLKIGKVDDGQFQVLDGLAAGETAVSSGSVFLSNLIDLPAD